MSRTSVPLSFRYCPGGWIPKPKQAEPHGALPELQLPLAAAYRRPQPRHPLGVQQEADTVRRTQPARHESVLLPPGDQYWLGAPSQD